MVARTIEVEITANTAALGITPTLSVNDDPVRLAVVTEPEELAGCRVGRVPGLPNCPVRFSTVARCGLTLGHPGTCWMASTDLVEEHGPFAIVEPMRP